MTTMHISIDESVAQALEERAKRAGKTAEQLAAELLTNQIPLKHNNEWIRDFLDHVEKHPGNSGGWKWNREELYDR